MKAKHHPDRATRLAAFVARRIDAIVFLMLAAAFVFAATVLLFGCAAPGHTDITPARRAALSAPMDHAAPIDRRPVWVINTFNGHAADDVGRHPRWRDSATDAAGDWLIAQARIGLDAGFTRFYFNLPAGNPRTLDANGRRTPMAGNQFHTLTPGARQQIARCVSTIRRIDTQATFGVYCGGYLDDTPDDLDTRDRHAPDFGSNVDRAQFAWQYGAWRAVGVTEICLDLWSSPEFRAQAGSWRRWLHREFGMGLLIEALPRTLPAYDGSIDDAIAREVDGAMALGPYFQQHDAAGRWVAPADAALFIGVRAGDALPDDLLISARDRGFIPWVYSRPELARVARVWGLHARKRQP